MRHITNSTKAERRIIECLKELRVPFKHRWLVEGREIDFIIGKYAIEVDGRKRQSYVKNEMLKRNGYTVIHFDNSQTKRSDLINYIEKICQAISLI